MSIIVSASFSPDSSKLAAVSTSHELIVWSIDRSSVSTSSPTRFRFSKESALVMKDTVLVSFFDSKNIGIGCGSTLLVVDADALVLGASVPSDCGSDPAWLLRRIAVPSSISCMTSADSQLLLGCSAGMLYTVGVDGRILRRICIGKSATVTAVQSVSDTALLIGTSQGDLLLVDSVSGSVNSSWKSPSAEPIRSLTVDSHRNWFCAVLPDTIVSGSTRSLVSVFVSPSTTTPVSKCEFAQLSSNGLSIVSAGPVTYLSVYPLDLSTGGNIRTQFDPTAELCAVADMVKSNRGDLIAVTGVGQAVLVISAYSLNLVHRFAL